MSSGKLADRNSASRDLESASTVCFAMTSASGLLQTKSSRTRRFENYPISHTHARTLAMANSGRATVPCSPKRRRRSFFFTTVRVYALCYLLVRIARPRFILPRDSRILFEADWVPSREGIAKAFEQLYGAQAA